MGGGANEKADLNLTAITSSNSWQQSGSGVTSGTVGSFNNHGNGSQNFTHAIINSGKNSGHNQAVHESTTLLLRNHFSGTHSSFNCYGKGSQDFSGATINSGGSGNLRSGPTTSEQQGRVAVTGTGTGESFNNYYGSTQLRNRASASTTLMGNCFRKLRLDDNCPSNSVLQSFKDAKTNSGPNSGDT